jgi:hypothetical protein
LPILPPGSPTPACSLAVPRADGSLDVLFTATPKQREFIERSEPNVLYVGARGTGKSICLRMLCHMYAMAIPGFQYALMRRTFPELRSSHLAFVGNEMQRLGGSWNQTQGIASYPNGSRGIYTHCASEADVLNQLSAEYGLMAIDEATTFPYDWIQKLSSSVRATKASGVAVAMLRLCTNPLGVSADDLNRHYVTKDIDPRDEIDYDPDDYCAVRTVMADNPHLDTKTYTKRFAGLTEQVRKAWVDGEYQADGTLFDFKPTIVDADGLARPYHVIPELPDAGGQPLFKQSWVRLFRAYDHGYHPDPACCLWIAHLGQRFIVFREQFWTKIIAPEIARQILDQSRGLPRVVSTLCDPTIDVNRGQDVRTILDVMEDEGLPLEPSVNNRELAAAAIHEALGTEVMPGVPKLQIVGSECPELVKWLPQMVANPQRPLAIGDHKHDHAIIALGYFLISQSAAAARESGKPIRAPGWKIADIDRALLGTRFGRPRTRRI